SGPASSAGAPGVDTAVDVDGATHTAAMRARGLHYGPAFRAVRGCHGGAAAIALDDLPDDPVELCTRLIDASWQVSLRGRRQDGTTLVPSGFDGMWIDFAGLAPTATVTALADG